MPEDSGRGGSDRRSGSGGSGRPGGGRPGARGGGQSGARGGGQSGPRGNDPGRGRPRGAQGTSAGRGSGAGQGRQAGQGGRGRGQESGSNGGAERGGPRLAPRKPRLPEPRIEEGVTGRELDRSVHQQLRTLSKENAEGVAQHLVMVAVRLEEDDIAGARAHAETAVRRAGRVPAAREALGMVAYRSGDWAEALKEFRTARRLSVDGGPHLLPLMVDCERALGRPERALELAQSPQARALAVEERVELAIVVSGIRRDLDQPDAARLALEIPQLKASTKRPWWARLAYAYAETLLASGRPQQARDWFARASDADTEAETDASERLAALDGVVLTDLLEPDGSGSPTAES